MTTTITSTTVTSRGGDPSFIDVTDQVRAAIADSGITTGTCSVISPHTTCAVYFDEFAHDMASNGNDDLQNDLNAALTKIVPAQNDFPPAHGYAYPGEAHFQAVESWPEAATYLPDGDRSQLLNADAHIKASILGSSEVFAVIDGKPGFGTTGYVFFVDFDRSRSRQRTCHIIVSGD
ncbi:YjbQ family protein [Helcobacillus sp. ACRRO]|uniref:YjbQ family protein n=1 Tax=Helcobacillus sp. ACRRO TaxID=2918202 RepID=UPI001EF477B1|nr:YjbQ family protein [Helcobacillus sp. ACRRO]MCG7428034.1 YjbQ family protein [Helcobacillus sp. ACRRO]